MVALVALGAGALPLRAQSGEVKPAAMAQTCELHIWPTNNYLSVNTGLLSGFGPLGALADREGHKDRVATVKDLMGEYLRPEDQVAELAKADVAAKLKLSGYKIVVEEAIPSADTKDPAVKAQLKAIDATIKSDRRLSTSQAPCYAELITSQIFYHKAMMYGSNLFAGWTFRNFAAGRPVATSKGAVKNPLEHFPPKTPDDAEAAKAELRDAFNKDFVEYVDKKVADSTT